VDVRFSAYISPSVKDNLDEGWFYTHNRYVHPEVVLKADNIIIQGLDEKNVWFSITPEEVFIFK